MMTTKPAVVIVHGAWHSSWHFASVIAELERAGHVVEAPDLPVVGLKPVENAVAKSITAVKQAIYNVTSSKRDAVVICHSMGGFIGSDGVAEFEEEMRVHDESGQHGRVSHLLYISAFILERTTDCFSQQRANAQPVEVRDGMLWHLDPVPNFYNTMEPALARDCAAQLRGLSLEAGRTPASHRGWADYGIPVTYMACEKDMALFFDPTQLKFIERLQNAGIKELTVERINCDHTPWLSDGRDGFFRVLWDVLGKAEKSSKL